MQAFFLYIVIIVSSLQFWWPILFFAVAYFSVRFGAGWLLPLAVLLDGYYGAFHAVPTVSILALIWYLFISVLRPHLLSVEVVS